MAVYYWLRHESLCVGRIGLFGAEVYDIPDRRGEPAAVSDEDGSAK